MTSSSYDDWPDIAGRLRRDLADGLDVAGVVEETDVLTRIGATSFEVVIDSSDLEGTDQASAYVVVLDLLATRMRQGAEQVLGCRSAGLRPRRSPRRALHSKSSSTTRRRSSGSRLIEPRSTQRSRRTFWPSSTNSSTAELDRLTLNPGDELDSRPSTVPKAAIRRRSPAGTSQSPVGRNDEEMIG